MAEQAIPVDLYNPGQVFACMGFLEAADVLIGNVKGGFDWSNAANVMFRLRAEGNRNPFEAVLDFLMEARISSLVPANATLATDRWGVRTEESGGGEPYPFPLPPSPATLPARLVADGKVFVIDHWGDPTQRDNVKFWAGSGGYPGVALVRDALDLVRDRLPEAVNDPFSLSAPQSSSFRFDWRRDYIPMDVGFSPNKHSELTMVGYPLVELLAAIGLANARPKRVNKLEYRYSVIAPQCTDGVVDPIILRAALGGAQVPFPQRFFKMKLSWPGQENQARCIVDVIEEARS
jgi:CRISPR-associated protein Csb3